jgi:hypothetical protein
MRDYCAVISNNAWSKKSVKSVEVAYFCRYHNTPYSRGEGIISAEQ